MPWRFLENRGEISYVAVCFYLGLGFFILHQKSDNVLKFFKTLFSKTHRTKTRTLITILRHASLRIDMKKYHTNFRIDIYDSY